MGFTCRKGKAFSAYGLAACCARPLGTLAGREEFSGTHMSSRKTYLTLFRHCGGETL